MQTNEKEHNTSRTWWKKGHIPWNKGMKVSLKPKTGWSIKCIVCGKDKYYEKNEHEARTRKYCSLQCYRSNHRDAGAIRYSSIHCRMAKKYGKADICVRCGSSRCVDWANIDHKYTSTDLSEWLKLCRKCHIYYDRKLVGALKK